jgi:hypothetical protein
LLASDGTGAVRAPVCTSDDDVVRRRRANVCDWRRSGSGCGCASGGIGRRPLCSLTTPLLPGRRRWMLTRTPIPSEKQGILSIFRSIVLYLLSGYHRD